MCLPCPQQKPWKLLKLLHTEIKAFSYRKLSISFQQVLTFSFHQFPSWNFLTNLTWIDNSSVRIYDLIRTVLPALRCDHTGKRQASLEATMTKICGWEVKFIQLWRKLAKKTSLLFFFSPNRLSQLLFYISFLFETLSSSFYFNQCSLLSCTVDPLIIAHRSSHTYTHTQSEQLSYATMLFFLVIEFILSLPSTPLFSSVSYLGQGLFVIIILTMHCQPN